MKEIVQKWLVQVTPFKGLLACGVRCPDETVLVPPDLAAFPKENLDYSLRCMADTFQVLKLNQLPNGYVRLIYENALLYCIKRTDGIFLGVFTGRETEAVDLEALGKMLAGFPKLGPNPPDP
jgi:hypothetical protein